MGRANMGNIRQTVLHQNPKPDGRWTSAARLFHPQTCNAAGGRRVIRKCRYWKGSHPVVANRKAASEKFIKKIVKKIDKYGDLV